MGRFYFLLMLLLPLAVFVASCLGGNDKDDDPAPASGGSDEDYLTAVCRGTSNFSDALVSKTTAAEISEVIRGFITEMRASNPPADLAEYNKEFVRYLENAVNDPTSLVTTAPPDPPEDARERLAAKESQVEACKNPTFFSRDDEQQP